MMVTVVQHPDLEDTVRVYIKGAPERIIENCNTHYDI